VLWPFDYEYDKEEAGDYYPDSVTLFGKVVHLAQLGNIAYGIVASDLGMTWQARAFGYGAGWPLLKTDHRAWDSNFKEATRAAAFELGVWYARATRNWFNPPDEDPELLGRLVHLAWKVKFVIGFDDYYGNFWDWQYLEIGGMTADLKLAPSKTKYKGGHTD